MNTLRLFAFTLALSIGWYFYYSPLFLNFLDAFLTYGTVFIFCSTVHAAFDRNIDLNFVKKPFSKSHASYWISGLIKLLFTTGLILAVNQFQTVQVTEKEHFFNLTLTGLLIATVIVSCLLPKKKTDFYFNLFLIIATATISWELHFVYAAPPMKDAVILAAPFNQKFGVISGGNSRLNNMKKRVADHPRSNGVHLIASPSRYRDPGQTHKEYTYTFGQTILAPCEGKVLDRVNDIPDNPINSIGQDQGPGNYIIIEKAHNQYVVLAHLKQNSIQVQVGEHVAVGQAIAQCGNSGFVTEPSLSIVVFDKPNLFDPTSRSQFIFFKDVELLESLSNEEVYYPKRGDFFIPQ